MIEEENLMNYHVFMSESPPLIWYFECCWVFERSSAISISKHFWWKLLV